MDQSIAGVQMPTPRTEGRGWLHRIRDALRFQPCQHVCCEIRFNGWHRHDHSARECAGWQQ